MATPTYTPLATITLSSSASSVTFSNISQSFRDVRLVVSGATTSSNTQIQVYFNNDTGSNYSYVQMYGTTSVGSDSNTLTSVRAIVGGTSGVGVATLDIMDYSDTSKYKTVLNRENNLGISWTGARASRWANTAAVSTIQLVPISGSFATGTTLSLYGIAA